MPLRHLLFSMLVGAFLLPAARAQDENHFYYMTIFANQSYNRDPVRYSHTFASFVEARGTGDDLNRYTVEEHTISWMPATEHPPLGLRVGIDYTLQRSIESALGKGLRVSKWGPFRIQEELYVRALKQIAFLNSGEMLFKTLDSRYRGEGASNCIHAVADIDIDNGYLSTGTARGDEASLLVARHLERWLIDERDGAVHETHEWVSERIGLTKYPIVSNSLTR